MFGNIRRICFKASDERLIITVGQTSREANQKEDQMESDQSRESREAVKAAFWGTATSLKAALVDTKAAVASVAAKLAKPDGPDDDGPKVVVRRFRGC